MIKLSKELTNQLNGKGYAWNNVLYTNVIGQGINSVLSLINQIVYNTNNNPYYNRNNIYSNNNSKIYLRAQQSPYKSTLSFGGSYL